jgi:CRP-like cAMP-binding protein
MRKIDTSLLIEQATELAWIGLDAKKKLADIAELELYESREVIYQGESGPDELMIIVDGSAQSMFLNQDKESLERIFYENQVLGLDALFQFNSRPRLIVGEGSTLILSFPMEKVRQILEQCSDTSEVYQSLVKNYGAYHFIRNSTFLGELLSPRFLIEFVSFFEDKNYENGNAIFNQNDDPDGFYLCHCGELKVEVKVKGQIVFTAPIKAGDYFGELALTTDSKRSATILSVGNASCYYLSRTRFDSLVQHEPRLLESFQLLAKLAYDS